MYRCKITFLFCFLFCIASLFACTTERGREGINKQQVEQTKSNDQVNTNQAGIKTKRINNQPVALKSWNEADYRLPTALHRQDVQSLSQQFPAVIFYKGSPNLKRVALTFDDGPDNYYTPRILDILHAKGVPATFFMVGKQAKHFPNMVKRIVAEGNAIGNHSWNHPKLWTLSNNQIKQEIFSTENIIQQITGRRSDLFRPPYGRLTPAEVVFIHSLGYRIIDWSVDTLDWKGSPAPQILQLVNKEVSSGGIILEHCLAGRRGELNGTLQALPQIIDRLRSQGYQFVTVQTLLSQ